MTLDVPYFMNDPSWYQIIPGKGIVLTDKAPSKAYDSYKEYMQKISERAKEEEIIEETI